ncbi:MAG: hypothetical protein ABMB14_13860 [Myxococcota bacterium]
MLLAWVAVARAQQPETTAPPPPPGPVAAEMPSQAPSETPAEPTTTTTPTPDEAASQPPTDVPLPTPDPLAAEVEALRQQLLEQQAALAAVEQELTDTRVGLLPKDDVSVTFEGHYRVRGYLWSHRFASQGTGDGYRDARYLDQRLWLRPRFAYKDVAKLWVEFRALDGVVFGDNAGGASVPLFAGDPSATDLEGQTQPTVEVGRVWTEFTVPVGVVRVGRMPSEWGMSLLVSPGDSFDQPFGESSFPSTNDRILFATRPIAIGQKVIGHEDTEVPLYAAVAVDRLVEDPLSQYYGYTCTPGRTAADDGFDRRCDTDGDGVTDLDHSYVDDTRAPASRGPDWWADQDDDVWQMVYVLVYRGVDVAYLGGRGDLTAGVYTVNRRQRETDSNVWIVDGHVKSTANRVYLESEVLTIAGETRALPLPDATAPDPLRKDVSIAGFAAKAGYAHGKLDALLEVGSASGDDDVTDATFTGRALNPDHNVGLVLYDMVLADVTAAVRTTAARGLWSNGGVYSSAYLFPTVTVRPRDGWTGILGAVVAWPNAPDGAVLRCNDDDAVGCDAPTPLQATADTIGWELDAAVKIDWADHLRFALEGAYAKVTDRVPLETAGLDPDGAFFTLQSRIAWEF